MAEEGLSQGFNPDRAANLLHPKNWYSQPSAMVKRVVGDLELPESQTVQKAIVIGAMVIARMVEEHNVSDKAPIQKRDKNYLLNAFQFLVFNLEEAGELENEDRIVLQGLQSVIQGIAMIQ